MESLRQRRPPECEQRLKSGLLFGEMANQEDCQQRADRTWNKLETASANTDEGSLGATVDLITARPFEYESNRFALSAQDAYYENGSKHNTTPSLTGIW